MNGNVADILAAYATGEGWMAKDTSQGRPTRDAVAALAYYFYELRGSRDGHDLDDWLRAEAQLARTILSVREGRST